MAGMDGELRAAEPKIAQIEQHCHSIANGGRNRSTLDTHAQRQNHNGVENDIGHSADHHAEHGDLRSALPLDQVAHGTAHNGGNAAHTDVEQIVPCVLLQIPAVLRLPPVGIAALFQRDGGNVGLGICTQNGQEPIHANRHQKRGEKSHRKCAPETETADLFHTFVFPCAQRTGNESAAAHAEQVAHRHQDHEDRRRHGHGVHLVRVVGLSHKDRVHHIIEHCYQHAQNRRHRQRCHCTGNGFQFKYGCLACFLLHL